MINGADRYGIAIWDRLAFADQNWDTALEVDVPAILNGEPCITTTLGGSADASFFQGDYEAARDRYIRLIERQPYKPALLQRQLHCHDVLCDWTGRIAIADALNQLIDEFGAIPGHEPLCYLTVPMDLARSCRFAQCRAAQMPTQKFRKQSEESGRSGRLRIGYISVDFRSHSCGTPLWPILNSHDRNRFHVFAYSFAPANLRDSIVSTLNDCAESVRDLADVSWDRALRRIRSDKLDILIDTTRNIRGAPLPLMTRRMAPTQVSAWGFGGAPNSAAIDIILGDGTTYPKGEDQNYHQPLVRLNAYLPPVENAHAELLLAPRNAKETAPPECIVLGSFVTHYKIDETVFTCWLRVLQQVPSSVIWLMAGTKTSRNNLRRYAAQRGVDPKRLHFTESVPRRQHLARLSQVDLILDNPRMGGSASIPDALATATPGITWQGELPEERGGASCLRAAGFPDLVAADINEYERLAVRLARSSAIRHSVRLRMAQHVKGAEAKVGTWVRQLEATLDDIALRQRQAQQFEKGA